MIGRSQSLPINTTVVWEPVAVQVDGYAIHYGPRAGFYPFTILVPWPATNVTLNMDLTQPRHWVIASFVYLPAPIVTSWTNAGGKVFFQTNTIVESVPSQDVADYTAALKPFVVADTHTAAFSFWGSLGSNYTVLTSHDISQGFAPAIGGTFVGSNGIETYTSPATDRQFYSLTSTPQ